jgi:hypothetical protein
MVEIGNVNLPVLADQLARKVAAADPKLFRRKFRMNVLRAGADAIAPRPLSVLGDRDADARRPEQAGGGLGDLLQRPVGIFRGFGNGAQDLGGGGQPGRQRVAFGGTLLELALQVADGWLRMGRCGIQRRGPLPGQGRVRGSPCRGAPKIPEIIDRTMWRRSQRPRIWTRCDIFPDSGSGSGRHRHGARGRRVLLQHGA